MKVINSDIFIGFIIEINTFRSNFLVKKNYYRLARIYHPDRVNDDGKATSKEKFSIVHQAYVILTDTQKRQQYDNGIDILFGKATQTAEWESFLKPVPNTIINSARLKYQNSVNERNDIEREFQAGKGSMTHRLNNLPFMRTEDEQRIIKLIETLIAEGSIPKRKIKKIAK